jgi:hypothetical protein
MYPRLSEEVVNILGHALAGWEYGNLLDRYNFIKIDIRHHSQPHINIYRYSHCYIYVNFSVHRVIRHSNISVSASQTGLFSCLYMQCINLWLPARAVLLRSLKFTSTSCLSVWLVVCKHTCFYVILHAFLHACMYRQTIVRFWLHPLKTFGGMS